MYLLRRGSGKPGRQLLPLLLFTPTVPVPVPAPVPPELLTLPPTAILVAGPIPNPCPVVRWRYVLSLALTDSSRNSMKMYTNSSSCIGKQAQALGGSALAREPQGSTLGSDCTHGDWARTMGKHGRVVWAKQRGALG